MMEAKERLKSRQGFNGFVKSFFLYLMSTFFLVANADSKQWALEKEQEGIRIYSGEESNSSLLFYKAEARVDANLAQLFNFLQNTQLTTSWLYDLDSIKKLEQGPNLQTYYYAIYSTPWPILDVSSVLEARWQYDKDKEFLWNQTRSVNRDEYSRAGFYEEDGFMHLPLIEANNSFQQLSDNQVQLTLEIKIDHGFLIPTLIMDSVSVDTLFKTLKNLQLADYKKGYSADQGLLSLEQLPADQLPETFSEE
jgi:hypothetical protein